MRILICALLVASTARAGETKSPKGDAACAVCHRAPQFDSAALASSVHQTLKCVDCHEGYAFESHAREVLERTEEETAWLAKLATKSSAPEAHLSCGVCHSKAADQLAESVHGLWLAEATPVAGPTCLDCHGPRDKMAPAVLAALAERYPADAATGFDCDDLRGAISVRVPLGTP